ncbi:unnamed protein product [Rhizoctonia solani]|uniref:Uncharacterized protein n=1 Tax=Rhizoctonia solani TaxID=456999 RepID=A0A8H2X3S2_9AGAM|nr:unnamed protein product [Rhizoctonia solani]
MLIRIINTMLLSHVLIAVFETYKTKLNYSDITINLKLYDVSGLVDYDSLRPLSYSGRDLVMVVFDISNLDSLENVLEKWLPEIRHFLPESVPIMLVGCKADITASRRGYRIVSYGEGRRVAEKIGIRRGNYTTWPLRSIIPRKLCPKNPLYRCARVS